MNLMRFLGAVLIVGPLVGCTPVYTHLPGNNSTAVFTPFADGTSFSHATSSLTSAYDGITMAYSFATNQGLNRLGVTEPGRAGFLSSVLYGFTTNGSLNPPLNPEEGVFINATDREFFKMHAAYGSDGLLTWGMWTSDSPLLHLGADGPQDVQGWIGRHTDAGSISDAGGGFQYIAGAMTPVLPATGLLHYTSLRGTPSPGTLGQFSGVTNGAEMSIVFGGATPGVGISITETFSPEPYMQIQMVTDGGLDQPWLSQVKVRSGTATFGGTGIDVTCVYGCGDHFPLSTPSPSGSVEGFFAGTNAERAGFSYLIEDGDTYMHGIFAMAQDTAVPDAIVPNLGDFSAALDITGISLANPMSMASGGPTELSYSNLSNSITSVTQDPTTGLVTEYVKTNTDGYVIGTAQGTEVGGDALITWGRWAGGTTQYVSTGWPPVADDTIGAEQGFHYIIGKPSTALPAAGTANFTLLGATKPTFVDGNASFPAGTLTSTNAIAMAVEWGGTANTKIGLDLTVTMPNDGAYRIQSTGGITTPGTSELSTSGTALFNNLIVPVSLAGGSRACNGGDCEAVIRGFFAGTDGARAGLEYVVRPTIGAPNTHTSAIVGVAAFTKQ